MGTFEGVRRLRNPLNAYAFSLFFLTIVAAVVYQAGGAASVVVPTTSCYVLDNSSHIYDFSSWFGYPFEYDGKDTDFVVRFCKDVESRSQLGYIDFGRFYNFDYFVAGSGRFDFVQEFYNGDLIRCEQSYDKRGRTAQVNIICGGCPNGQCRGGLGCICNVTHESTCRVLVELAIPCEKQGLRVFEGFTVGFHPRSWEVVYNGMTQLGFEKAYGQFSFKTDQTHVALYMTAVASLSGLVRKPIIKILPEEGLEVRLAGSGATGNPPTTLSPTLLDVDWRCAKVRDSPYEVQVTIPVEGYDPIQFTLAKMCDYRQGEGGKATRGWASFGVISCILFVVSTLFCCGGFVYKTQVEKQRGLDALPGMIILSACLETVSGRGHSTRPDDLNSPFASQASWARQPVASPRSGSSRTSERRYGSI